MKGWKKLQSPEAQEMVKTLEGAGYVTDRTEKWMPWLFGQARQGNLEFRNDPNLPGPQQLRYQNPYLEPRYDPNIIDERSHARLTPATWRHWGDWFNSGHPTRQAIDPNKASIQDVHRAVDTWGEDMEARKKEQDAHTRKNDGEVVHALPNQWTIRKLQTKDEAKREGEAMGHCVGSYGGQIEAGDTLAYSLRDPKGHPHVTFGIDPMHHVDAKGDLIGGKADDDFAGRRAIPHEGTAYNVCGTGNSDPKPEYRNMIKNWMDTFSDEDRPYGEGADDDYGGYITHPEELENLGPPGDEQGLDEYGMRQPDVDIDYKTVMNNMIKDSETGYRGGGYRGDPELLYQHALARKEIPALAKHLEEFQQDQQENFDEWRDMNYEHQQDPFPQDDDFDLSTPEGNAAYDEAEKAHYEEEEQWAREHPGMNLSNAMYKLVNPHWHEGETSDEALGEGRGYRNEQRVAASSGPLYYRWVFTPSGVELSHNQDEHPSNLQFHQDLGSEVNEQSMVHGYAYRIRNGWRLTDWEHRPLTDPYVIKSVVEAIRNEEGTRTASEVEPSWEPEWDFERFHYGRPLPRLY